MKRSLAEAETKSWSNARIIDINVTTNTRPRFSVSFVIQFDDSRYGGNTNWKRSKALMHGSVIALCLGGQPVRMGTIVVREDNLANEWLNAPGRPRIGVAFESDEDFRDSIQEMVKNCAWNEKFLGLRKKYESLGRNDPQRASLEGQLEAGAAQLTAYDLVEASKSFFAYKPILKTLQEMETIPLKEELAGTGPFASTPTIDYLPNDITLPEKDFGGAKVHLNDWSSSELVEKTSLDKSQAEALKHAFSSRVVLIQGPPGTFLLLMARTE